MLNLIAFALIASVHAGPEPEPSPVPPPVLSCTVQEASVIGAAAGAQDGTFLDCPAGSVITAHSVHFGLVQNGVCQTQSTAPNRNHFYDTYLHTDSSRLQVGFIFGAAGCGILRASCCRIVVPTR